MSSPGIQEYRDREAEFQRFLNTYCNDSLSELYQHYPSEQTSLVVDWREVYKWDADTAEGVEEATEHFREAFETAVFDHDKADMDLDIDVRFAHVGEAFGVGELTGEHVNEILSVSGVIAKSSEVMPRLTTACLKCGATPDSHPNYIKQPRIGVKKPPRCKATDCKSQSFTVDFEESEYEPHQVIRVKQPPEEADNDQDIDVHLWGDACGGAKAGDRVTITGRLKTDFDGFEKATPDFWVDAEHVATHESDYEDVDVSSKSEEFKALANGESGNPYEVLIDSIAPTIKGEEKMETIKLAVALQLFGGWRRAYGDGRYARGDSHIAIIGGPGTGKSSILEAANTISPRSGYVSGKNATQAGVTAAAVRDDFGDTEWSLEAGAIVKAHKGLCCIDEIDKVDGGALSSLHTALEKQRLEFNKAGIDASLPCHTAILAAGNPSEGKFVDGAKIIDQLNIGPTLRSRFDLVFTLEDTPEYESDKELADHMAKVRQASAFTDSHTENPYGDVTIEPDVDLATLRAWVAFARENVFPAIQDPERTEAISEWFASKRNGNPEDMGDGGAGNDLNRRVVDAICRLAEASARVRLSGEVNEHDIQRAKDIVEQSLDDLGLASGEIDSIELETGYDGQHRELRRSVEGIIETLQSGDGSGVEKEAVIEAAVSAGHTEAKAKDMIRRLRDNSVITTAGCDEGCVRAL